MAAFWGAAEEGADCAELDVRQTKDGVPVVMHDSNLMRTAGVNREICEVTYDELRSLKVKKNGGLWSDRESIPTLQEVLRFLKGSGLMLNIELKPCRGASCEKTVVDLILKEDLQDQCLIASSDCGILQRVKSYAPEIKTVYVGCDFKSCLLRLRCVDAISLKADYVSASVVQSIHVATKVTVINGKYYAVINSLTNSTYSVVWNPIEFSDVSNHWAKTAINDMCPWW